jgi:hypothetical protein
MGPELPKVYDNTMDKVFWFNLPHLAYARNTRFDPLYNPHL